ncbi:MAG: hypothetical protein ACOZF0_22145 [Thermodesulfobacteriota bacterium]
MKFFSLKILALCILLPPVLYIVTLLIIEGRTKTVFTNDIEKCYIGDTRELLNGNIHIRAAIARNIHNFLNSSRMISWGVKSTISVATKKGTVLYPALFEMSQENMAMSDPMTVAAENFAIMNEGLLVSVDIEIGHNTFLSNLILVAYILMALAYISVYYRSGIRKIKRSEEEANREIERLANLKTIYTDRLDTLSRTREELQLKCEQLKNELENEKMRAMKNEDQLIDEIVNFEARIEKNILLQEEQNEEIETLKEIIKELEKGSQRDPKQMIKGVDMAHKRFRAIYKNTVMHKRAVEGYIDLSDEMRIKSEEIIHQLNDDATKVHIKRKVFHRKSRETVLEVTFGYRGRLYFRKIKDNKIEVLSIGTKNSQAKDLEFLDSL